VTIFGAGERVAIDGNCVVGVWEVGKDGDSRVHGLQIVDRRVGDD
jgi:hypothetical protein